MGTDQANETGKLLATTTCFILIRFIQSYPLPNAGSLEDFHIRAVLGEKEGQGIHPILWMSVSGLIVAETKLPDFSAGLSLTSTTSSVEDQHEVGLQESKKQAVMKDIDSGALRGQASYSTISPLYS